MTPIPCRPLLQILLLLSFSVAGSVDTVVGAESGAEGGGAREGSVLRGSVHRSLGQPYCGDYEKKGLEDCDAGLDGGPDDENCGTGVNCQDDCTCESTAATPTAAPTAAGSPTAAPAAAPTAAGPQYDLYMTDLRRVNCPSNCGSAKAGDPVYGEILLSGFIYSATETVPLYYITFYLTPDQQNCDPTDPDVLELGSSRQSGTFNQDSSGNWYHGMGGGAQMFIPESVQRGSYYFCARVDWRPESVEGDGGEITESDETNNVAFTEDNIRISPA